MADFHRLPEHPIAIWVKVDCATRNFRDSAEGKKQLQMNFLYGQRAAMSKFQRGNFDTADGFMVTLGRFELPTCGLGNRRSIHLSYRATTSEFTTSYLG